MEHSGIKKAKLSPLKQLTVGDSMVDIKLRIVTTDAIRILPNTKVRTMIGSDGSDFVNVSFWGDNVDRFSRDFGEEFLGKTFALGNFSVFNALERFNRGSLPIELRPKDSSTVALIKSKQQEIQGDWNDYYKFLRIQHALDQDDFRSIPLANIRSGEKMIDTEGELIRIKPIRIVQVKGQDSKVLDAEIVGEKTKAVLNAWNVYAEFLDEFLRGKEGCKVKIQNGSVKRILPEPSICFDKNTKISIAEKIDDQSKAVRLADLVGKRGLCLMHLRVRIAKKQVQQGMRMDGTIVQDGFNKCQLLFPNNMKLIPGEEITILSASVAWNDGAVTLTVYSDDSFIRSADVEKTIGDKDLGELFYPQQE